jgi:hypothetical protein
MDIDVALLELHRRLLAVPVSSGLQMIEAQFVVSTALGGAFLCSAGMHPGIGDKKNEKSFHIRAKTWVSDEQLADDQIAHSARLLTPRTDEPPMVSTLMLPYHLRGLAPRAEADASHGEEATNLPEKQTCRLHL